MTRSFALVACVLLLASALVRAESLPAACGNDNAKFDVTTIDAANPQAPLEPGKARLVLLEDENMVIGPFMHATVRFGLDGHWVGANHGNSYFVIDVPPGEHHVCATWKPALQKESIELAPVTAKPGKVYYLSARVTVESKYVTDFSLSNLNADQGSYRMQKSQLATWKQK